MFFRSSIVYAFLGWLTCFGSLQAATEVTASPAGAAKNVIVIPIQGAIARPVSYILRRGLKEAIEQKADAVVIDLKTPGGALDVTLSMMEALEKFPGTKIAYINDQALSAGAFISASTDEIWFAPRGKIGAAAPVDATGQDIDATMRQKIISFLKAEVRSVSQGRGYRGEVISAMIDENFELKIGDQILKPKGELLTLTAAEASAAYGQPPTPLLAAGVATSIDDLLTQKYGRTAFVVKTLEVTWSERLAVWMNAISPVLLGLGLLALFIEFKTPGFGFFGISGIALLLIVFLSNYVAGLSGHEPMLAFGLGLLLVAIEVFFVPGVIVIAVMGLLLMGGALIWSMVDFWPNQAAPSWTLEMFVAPLSNVTLGLLIAIVLGLLLARFLPQRWIWSRLVLQAAVVDDAHGGLPAAQAADELINAIGTAVTALRPTGVVEINGRRYQATVEVGDLEAGAAIVVRGRGDFNLLVEGAGR